MKETKKTSPHQRKLLESYLEELISTGKTWRESVLNIDEDEDLQALDDAVSDFTSFAAHRRAATHIDQSNTERPQEKTRGKKLGPWYDLWVAEDPSHTLEKWRGMKEGERSKERNRIHMLHPHLQRKQMVTDVPVALAPPTLPGGDPSNDGGTGSATISETSNNPSPRPSQPPPPPPALAVAPTTTTTPAVAPQHLSATTSDDHVPSSTGTATAGLSEDGPPDGLPENIAVL